MQKHIKKWWGKKGNRKAAFYIYFSVILVFTLTPVDKLKPSFLDGFLFDGADKLVHTLMFIIMAFFFHYAFKIKIFKALIILFFIGVLIEILQGTLNLGRSFEWMDIFADFLGVIIFYSLINKFLKALKI